MLPHARREGPRHTAEECFAAEGAALEEPRHAALEKRVEGAGTNGAALVVRLDDVVGDGRGGLRADRRGRDGVRRAFREASGDGVGAGGPGLCPGRIRRAVDAGNQLAETVLRGRVAPATGAVAGPAGLLRPLDHRGADGIEVDVPRHGHQRAERTLEKDALEAAFPDRAGVLVALVVVLRVGLLERLAELGEIVHPGAHPGLFVLDQVRALLLRPLLPLFEDRGELPGAVPGEHPPLQLLVRDGLLPRHAHEQVEVVGHHREREELHARESRRAADHPEQDPLLVLVDEKTLPADPAYHVVEPLAIDLDSRPSHSALLSAIPAFSLRTSRNLSHLPRRYKNFLRGQTPLKVA